MKFLIDKSPAGLQRRIERQPDLICGQLLTPLTRYSNAGIKFAIDNGAFSTFEEQGFLAIINRDQQLKHNCLFVVIPDIVGNARRTLEIWKHRDEIVRGWPLALVAQDGIEDMEIPWDELDCLFIGGRDPWKDSQSSQDIVRTAKILKKHVHIGRVNTFKRFKLFAEIGADTCDGSGAAMYDHMLDDIAKELNRTPEPMLWDVKTLDAQSPTG